MVWAFLLLNACVILAAAGLRFSGGGLALAAPVPLTPGAWWGLTALAAAAGLAAALRDRRRLRHPGARWALVELLIFFPLLFGYLWAAFPLGSRLGGDYLAFAVLAAVLLGLMRSDGRHLLRTDLALSTVVPAARGLLLPTLVMVLLPVATALFVGTDFRPGRAAFTLAKYAGWSAVQLLLFQTFLVPRLCRLTESRRAVVAAAAALFALAHWPNALLMAACGGAAILWTAAYLRLPNLIALAASMALAATAFTSALPDRFTKDMRVGPGYVEAAPLADVNPRLVELLSSQAYLESRGGTTRGFVLGLYEDVMGHEPDPADLDAWVGLLERGTVTRPEVVRKFLDGKELRRKLHAGPVTVLGHPVVW